MSSADLSLIEKLKFFLTVTYKSIETAVCSQGGTTCPPLCLSSLGRPSVWLKENSVFLKPRPYFWLEIRLSTHREQFGEDRRPLRAI